MKNDKVERHNTILKIISSDDITTQDMLVEMLLDRGFNVTQATVSRDIKDLQLTKVQTIDGQYKYASYQVSNKNISAKFKTVFKEAVLNIDYAVNMIVVTTLPGMANAAAAAIDSMNLEDILGTIAGDDNIFVVARSQKGAAEIVKQLKAIL